MNPWLKAVLFLAAFLLLTHWLTGGLDEIITPWDPDASYGGSQDLHGP